MNLKGDNARMGNQHRPDNNETRKAAWRALWEKLLNPKREELAQRRHCADDSVAAQRKSSSKREGRALG